MVSIMQIFLFPANKTGNNEWCGCLSYTDLVSLADKQANQPMKCNYEVIMCVNL